MSPDPKTLFFCYTIRRLLALAITFFLTLFLASQVELTNRGKLRVLFSRLRAAEVFEVNFCDLHGAMPHLARELEDLAAALQVEFREGMTERMRRDAHASQAALFLDIFQNRLHAANPERFVRKAPAPPALPTAA